MKQTDLFGGIYCSIGALQRLLTMLLEHVSADAMLAWTPHGFLVCGPAHLTPKTLRYPEHAHAYPMGQWVATVDVGAERVSWEPEQRKVRGIRLLPA